MRSPKRQGRRMSGSGKYSSAVVTNSVPRFLGSANQGSRPGSPIAIDRRGVLKLRSSVDHDDCQCHEIGYSHPDTGTEWHGIRLL